MGCGGLRGRDAVGRGRRRRSMIARQRRRAAEGLTAPLLSMTGVRPRALGGWRRPSSYPSPRPLPVAVAALAVAIAVATRVDVRDRVAERLRGAQERVGYRVVQLILDLVHLLDELLRAVAGSPR